MSEQQSSIADQYLDLRRKGELSIASALDRFDMLPEQECELLSQELGLIVAEARRAIDGDESAEGRIESAMKGFLRNLTGRRVRHGVRIADADGQVGAAFSLLKEIRTARRGFIEALREEISESGDIGAANECCRLLEEEIDAARASKDEEGERIAAASLEVVRRLATSEEEDEA